MNEYTISQWVLFFYIYCFLGWGWESTYVSLKKRKLVNRGFLKGPFLPIYGSGAVCILIVTIPVRDSIPLMFLAGMIFPTLLEYVTGAVMERLFRVRYWDYTGKFMNVNGYICLGSTLCWGVMTVLLAKEGHQYVERLVFAIDEKHVTMLVMVITPLLTADFVTSFHAAIRLRDILVRNERIQEELKKLSEKKQEMEQALLEMSGKAKEKMLQAAEGGEQALREMSEKAKEKMLQAAEESGQAWRDMSEKAKEQSLFAIGGKTREQAAQEMQELLLKIGELRGRMSIPDGKSIRGLLKRNPTAVSKRHKDTFAELKQTLSEKLSRK